MQKSVTEILPISKKVLTKDTPLDSTILDSMVDLIVMSIFRQLSIYKRSGEMSMSYN